MKITITIHENESPIEAQDITRVDQVIAAASEEARSKERLNIISLEAGNGNDLMLVVGGDETVLGFNNLHPNPPYYASKGTDERDEPVMTAYVALFHHTEFPRKWIVPMHVAMLAVHEFCETGELPKCIEWVEA